MRTSRGVVLWGLGHHSVGVTNEQQVEGVFLVLGAVYRQVFQLEVSALILEHIHFRQIKQTLGSVVLVEEIVTIGIVNFQVADVDLERGVCLLLDMVKDVRNCAWNQTSVRVAFSSSSDCKCLA